MSVASPCHICGVGNVEYTCDRCGNLVCDEHFEEDYGLCVECVSDVGRDDGTIPSKEDMPDGVDTYRL